MNKYNEYFVTISQRYEQEVILVYATSEEEAVIKTYKGLKSGMIETEMFSVFNDECNTPKNRADFYLATINDRHERFTVKAVIMANEFQRISYYSG